MFYVVSLLYYKNIFLKGFLPCYGTGYTTHLIIIVRMAMKKLLLTLCTLGFLSNTSLSYAANDDIDDLRDSNSHEWRLIKDDRRRNLKTYDKRDNENSGVRSFKVDATMNASLETLARIYCDIDNYPRWFWTVREAKILKRVSDKEFYYYLQHDAPVGVPDRDVIIRATIEPYTAKKGYAIMRLKAVPDYIPARPPFVRMQAEDMEIRMTPLSADKTHLHVEGYIHPGGVIPAWAINAVQRQAPYYTTVGFQRMIKLPQYNDATIPMPFPIRD